MGPTDVYVSTPARVLTGATALAAVVAVAGLAGDVGPADLVGAAAVAALAVLAVWALFGRPAVEVSDGTVVLRGVLRTVTIPWPTVVRTEVDWSLVVVTTAGRWTAWAAPRASSGLGRRRRAAGPADDAAPATAPVAAATAEGARRRHAATAEGAAAAIEGRLAGLRAAGHLADAERVVVEHGLRPAVAWHTATIAAAAALAGAAAATRLV